MTDMSFSYFTAEWVGGENEGWVERMRHDLRELQVSSGVPSGVSSGLLVGYLVGYIPVRELSL